MCQVPKDVEHELHDKRHEFFKLDYEKALSIIKQLHEQRINYQKFYIFLCTAIVTASILILKLPSGGGTVSGIDLSVTSLIGVLFLFAGIIGYIVIRNLASIRCSEVFFNNTIIDLRNIYIKRLQIKGYTNLHFARTDDRCGADYASILGCSFINMLMFVIGWILILDGTPGIQLALTVGFSTAIYVGFHWLSIENTLSRGIGAKTEP